MNKFTFHSVGQGLFYGGYLRSTSKTQFSFVYDCGKDKVRNIITSNKSESINFRKQIDKYKKKLKKSGNLDIINALFISHLDLDHISGLPYLLDNVVVEKLYIPYISGQDSFFLYSLLLDYISTETTVIYEVVLVLPEDGYDDEIEFLIKPNSDLEFPSAEDFLFTEDSRFKKDEDSGYMERRLLDLIRSGKIYMRQANTLKVTPIWQFDLFVTKGVQPYLSTINSIIYTILIANGLPGNLPWEKIIKHQSVLSEINKELKKQLNGIFSRDFSNVSSLCVYHNTLNKSKKTSHLTYPDPLIKNFNYPLNNKNYSEKYDIFYNNLKTPLDPARTGTLLTGDANDITMTHSRFSDYYRKYSSSIGIFSLPHHGSQKNWLKNEFKDYYINSISVPSHGFINNHNHPSSSVLKDILNVNGRIVLVNEYNYFTYSIN